MKEEIIYINPKYLKVKLQYKNAVTPLTKQEDDDLDTDVKTTKKINVPLFISEHSNIILDGHHRNEKALKYEIPLVPCIVKHFDSLLAEFAFVQKINLLRRNMNEAQKIINAQGLHKTEEKLAKQRQKKGTLASKDAKGKTSHKVAKIIGVSPTIYEKGRTILNSKNKEQIEKWTGGIISTTSAYNNIQQVKYQQKTLVKLPKTIKPLIVEDPPWFYGFFETSYNTGKTAAQYYPVMKLEELKKLNLGSIAAEDAVCLMWCTGPTFPWALELMASQGFKFKTIAFVWIKTTPTQKGHIINLEKDIWFGLGNYTRSNAEYVLLGTRGKGLVRMNKSVPQVFIGPVGKHSAKPKEIYKRIKKLYGEIPAYECFAREANVGFTPWGNEIKK